MGPLTRAIAGPHCPARAGEASSAVSATLVGPFPVPSGSEINFPRGCVEPLMHQHPLQSFIQQLGHWAGALINRDRSPFRWVDIFPRVRTAGGDRHPALVVWINRASFMAGGVILVPQEVRDEDLESGQQCSTALGLRHFVTWGADEVVCWEVGQAAVLRHKSWPAPALGSDAPAFRQSLAIVLEAMKYLAVAGTIPPEELGAHYLANLCHMALQDVQPSLAEIFRMARGEGRVPAAGDTERLARAKAFHTLLRLLALVAHDQLPAAVQPEGLERAMFFALDSIPATLGTILAPGPDELPLPLDAAVRFHHLLRRLNQLGTGPNRLRTAELVELLSGEVGNTLEGTWRLSPCSSFPGPRFLINPEQPQAGPLDWEIGGTPLLAAMALLRDLRGLPPAAGQVTTPFDLPIQCRARAVVGAFQPGGTITTQERKALTERLRLSWPARRFPLPPAAPRWAWELVHVAGLVCDGAELHLQTPGDWLGAPFAAPILHLIRDQFTLKSLCLTAEKNLQLTLIRSALAVPVTEITLSSRQRQVPWAWLRAGHLSRLPLALHLPDRLFSSLVEEQLTIPEETDWPAALEWGVLLFTRSTLGRGLWRLLAPNQPLPNPARLKQALLERGLPLPRPGILLQLQQFPPLPAGGLPGVAQIDAELSPWFETNQADLLSPPPGSKRQAPSLPRSDRGALAESLRDEVFSDGLPVFPEQYLYAYYRPPLQDFDFTPPLQRGDEFFGKVIFHDAGGQVLEAGTRELALALQLVAATGRSKVSLPADPEVQAAVLDRYLQDLRDLHGRLTRLAHGRAADQAQAIEVINTIWQGLKLPPPNFFIPLIQKH